MMEFSLLHFEWIILYLDVLVGLKSEYDKEVKTIKSTVLNSKLLKSRLNEIYDEYFYEFDSLLDVLDV